MPMACLLVPALPLACELAQRPDLRGRPIVITDEAGLRVAHVSGETLSRGVRPGMTLREAVAFVPALAVLEPRPARVARAAHALIDAIGSVSPCVEEAEPGVVFADLAGLERLYPRPGLIEQALFDATPAALGPRVGIAETRFTAFAAAHQSPAGTSTSVGEDEATAFLAEKPTAWLPLDEDAREHLHLLGIETLGGFAALPRHAVEAQFGVSGGLAWLAARGEDPTPLRPQHLLRERVIERSQAQPPLISHEAIARSCEQLLGRALRQPRAAGRFVRYFRISATGEEGGLWERKLSMKEPTGDRGRLWLALRTVLEQAEYPGPIAELELELGGLTSESARQRGLFRDRLRRREELDEMVRHLKLRYGQSPLARIVALDPRNRLPERRHALMDYDP